MLNSVNTKNNIAYGAVKDVVPQNVAQKLPEGIQNIDAKETVNDSFIGSVGGGMFDTQGLKPAQLILSVLGAAGLVFGGSALLRRFVKNNGIFKMGEKLDDIYDKLKTTKFGEFCKNIKSKFSGKFGDKLKNSSFGKLFGKDANGVRPNMMRPEVSMVQMYTKGSKFEACDEITDALTTMLNGGPKQGKISQFFTKNIGEKIGWVKKGGTRFSGEEGVRNLIKLSGHADEADDLIKLLKKYSENATDVELKFQVKDKFVNVLKDYFKVNGKGKMSDLMGKAVNTDLTQRVKIGMTHEVNMLNALKNMLILDGKGARTPLGQGAQKFLLKAVEGPTNGIMSRSKSGLAMALAIYFGIFNKVQKAPKGEKVATAGEEMTGDIGTYMLMPVTSGLMYGLASFKNLGVDAKNYKTQLKALNDKFKLATNNVDKQAIIKEFKNLKKATYSQGTWWQKILRIPGRILSFGLEKGPGGKIGNKVKGIAGGALRFATFMFALSPLLIKPIMAVSRKLFGKTSEVKKQEEEARLQKEQKKLRKEQLKNGANQFNMSQEELAQKLMQNPAVLERLQNDPALLEQVAQNPAMLEQLINEASINNLNPNAGQNPPASSSNAMSPALANYLKNKGQNVNPNQNTNVQPAGMQPLNNVPQGQNTLNNIQPNLNAKNDNQVKDENTKRSYVPSTTPVQNVSNVTAEQQMSINKAMMLADSAEKSASRFL
ncbi:MAG: hypothetical protein E7Z91_02905 [Cyanobacteria bacterium SIG30]|nr:hypothetical protein [Cyanobacteria bacterium SIG30]